MKYIYIVCAVIVFGFILNIGMNKSEVVNCNKWKAEASEYANYYLLQWQADQCAAHNIEIDAPIK